MDGSSRDICGGPDRLERVIGASAILVGASIVTSECFPGIWNQQVSLKSLAALGISSVSATVLLGWPQRQVLRRELQGQRGT
jgi:hypothetical protein